MLLASLNSELSQSFIRLVAEQTGLDIRDDEYSSFCAKILARSKALKLPIAEAYYELLVSKTAASLQEWQNLAVLLTNPESFFWRDKNQFELLRNRIMPELIARKQTDRTIRICSAGCSTGEEAYSIAILLKELLINGEGWRLTILGVDLNPDSLKKARAGVYRQWSFRGVDSSVQQRYFKQIHDKYHIDPRIRQMVEFETLNLVKDPFPLPQAKLNNMDLILCRNVFIYFHQAAIAHVLNKLYCALQPLGYLITGHAELHAQDLSQFETKAFPEAIVYQRPDVPPEIVSSEDFSNSLRLRNISNNPNHSSHSNDRIQGLGETKNTFQSTQSTEHQLIQRAEKLLKQKAYTLAVQQVRRALELNHDNAYAHYLMAQILVALNDMTGAMVHCQRAIDLDHSFTSPQELLDRIAKEETAKEENC